MSTPSLYLPLIDLSSTDRAATAKSIRQACVEHGFFYLINHGINDFVVNSMFRESKKLFDLPLSEKMKLEKGKNNRGYTPSYAETLDLSSKFKEEHRYIFRIAYSSARGLWLINCLYANKTQDEVIKEYHISRALIVNIGDLMERWTNCTFRSTLHRVVAVGEERYSAAFFLDPNYECVVECLESCCSETSPPRFPPIKSGDYLKERFRLSYGY